MRYDVVFIDWDLTLSGSRFWGHWAVDPKRQKDIELIRRLVFASNSGFIDDWMRGRYSAEEAVTEIARRTGLDANKLLLGLRESCANMTLYDNQTLDMVDGLRAKGVKIVIATDNMDTFSRWTVPALGLNDHFDEILNSHELKARKKDKSSVGGSAFFADFFERYRIDPARSVLIDDSIKNKTVEDFGMIFVQVVPEYPAVLALANVMR